jgi:hypothetical protein
MTDSNIPNGIKPAVELNNDAFHPSAMRLIETPKEECPLCHTIIQVVELRGMMLALCGCGAGSD